MPDTEQKQQYESLLHPEWKIVVTKPEETGMRVFSVRHPDKDIPTVIHVAETNPTVDSESTKGWVAARTSRSQLSFEEAFREAHEAMLENPAKAAEQIARIFVNYGHASVGDMVPIFLHFNEIPIHLAYEIFHNISVGAGQESSTRYIAFDNLGIDSPDLLLPLDTLNPEKSNEIKERWTLLQERMACLYSKWFDHSVEAYSKKFPDTGEKTTISRARDVSRLWIPAGAKTSVSLLMSARDWERMIRILRESTDIRNQVLGEQVMQVLRLSETEEGKDISMRLGSLLRHTQPTHTIPSNLRTLKRFLTGRTNIADLVIDQFEEDLDGRDILNYSKVEVLEADLGRDLAMQGILEIFPQLDEKQLLQWLNALPNNVKSMIGGLMLRNHSDHDQMRNTGDIRSSEIFVIKSAIAYLRDLGRHKAFGRFTDLFGVHEATSILRNGFIRPVQIFDEKGMAQFQDEWVEDASMLYQELFDLASLIQSELPDNDGRWLLRLLPLGHISRLHFSSSIGQLNYMIALREKRGGDFGYIEIVQNMLKILRNNPYLKFMLRKSKPLDLESLEEFKARN